jgi:hypothetical protein
VQLFVVPARDATPSKSLVEISVRGRALGVTVVATVL